MGPGIAEDRAKSCVGKQLAGRYRLESLIGLGGMSAVFRATDLEGKPVAVKILYPELSDTETGQRFERESKLVQGLAHPHVVSTLASGRDAALSAHYLGMPGLSGRHMASVLEEQGALAPESAAARTVDSGSDEALGMPYIVMELLHGTDLFAVLEKEGALDPQVAVRLVLQAASGVAAAHALGVIHRDIRPANFFLQVDDVSQQVTVKVCDFGVAKRARVNESSNAVGHPSLTRTDGMLGWPMYMSPEQAKNAEAVDERTDVWSLSVVLWEALSGRKLWGGQTSFGELIIAICSEPISQLETVAPWVPRDLARVVQRGLEREPSLRPSLRGLIESLSVFAGGTDRVQKSQLVKMTEAERGALQVRVNISASAAAGIANLARGGRGGTSLPPERQRRSGRPVSPGTSMGLIIVMLVVIGSLSVVLVYLLHKR